MVKTRPQLIVALALSVPLAVAPATRASANPLESCQYLEMESPRSGGHAVHVCPPMAQG